MHDPTPPLARHIASCALGACALLAAGCAALNPPPPVDVLPTAPPALVTAPAPTGPASGSLFRAVSYRPALEDQRARFVGDLVTIEIAESIDAKQNTQSNVGRNSSNKGGIAVLPLLPTSLIGKAGLEAGYENSFNGKGDTSSKNTFRSAITAIVTEVLPNGQLVIAGEKQVGVNRSVDVLRFSGIVDPRHLRRGGGGHGGNVIDSQYVANVRVISRGMGEQAEAQAMGWLARVFNTLIPF